MLLNLTVLDGERIDLMVLHFKGFAGTIIEYGVSGYYILLAVRMPLRIVCLEILYSKGFAGAIIEYWGLKVLYFKGFAGTITTIIE